MQHTSPINTANTSLFNALQTHECSICMEPLAAQQRDTQQSHIIRAHQPTASASGTDKAQKRLDPIPEDRSFSSRSNLSPGLGSALSREHLFHIECYAEHIARNGQRVDTLQRDWALRCPLCQQPVNLSQIEPYPDTTNQQNCWQSHCAKNEVQQTVRHAVEALIKENNLTRYAGADASSSHDPSPLGRGLFASPRQVVARGRHPYPFNTRSHLNVGMHGYGASANIPPHEPLEPGTQQAFGSIMAGVGVAIAALHGPIGLAVMVGFLGTSMISAGALRQCTEGQRDTPDNGTRLSGQDALVLTEPDRTDTLSVHETHT